MDVRVGNCGIFMPEKAEACLRVDTAAQLLLQSAQHLLGLVSKVEEGELEQRVREAASACWEGKTKSVQVKGRFFRNKTVYVEEPLFLNDAEQRFGAELDAWRKESIDGIAAAAVNLSASHQRLLISIGDRIGDAPFPERLSIFFTLLSLYDELSIIADRTLYSEDRDVQDRQQPLLQSTSRLVQCLLQQVGSNCLEDVDLTLETLVKIAHMLVSHSCTHDWALHLVGSRMKQMASIVLVLEGIARESSLGSRVRPDSLLKLLSYLDYVEYVDDAKESLAFCQALCSIQLETIGSMSARASLFCLAVRSMLSSLEEKELNADGDEVTLALDSLLLFFMAASKGASTMELPRMLNLTEIDSRASLKAVGSLPLQQLAAWASAPPLSASGNENALREMISVIPWRVLTRHCSSHQRICWLLALVSSQYTLYSWTTQSQSSEASSDESQHSLVLETLRSREVWTLTAVNEEGCAINLEDARSLYCITVTEHCPVMLVQNVWIVLQALMACQIFVREAREASVRQNSGDLSNDAAPTDVDRFMQHSSLDGALQRLIGCGEAEAVMSLCIFVLEDTAITISLDEVTTIVMPCMDVAVGVGEGRSHRCVGILAHAMAKALQEILQKDIEDKNTSRKKEKVEDNIERQLKIVSGLLLALGSALCASRHLSESPLMKLTSMAVNATYAAIVGAGEAPAMQRIAVLLDSLQKSLRGLSQTKVDLMLSRLFSLQTAWPAVLGVWIADARLLGSNALSEGVFADNELDIKTLSTMLSTDATKTEMAASDLMALLESIAQLNSERAVVVRTPRTALLVAVLWYELFLRVRLFEVAVQPLLSREDVLRELQKSAKGVASTNQDVADALTSLCRHLDIESTLQQKESGGHMLPIVGSFLVARELSNLERDWESWAKEASHAASVTSDVKTLAASRLPPVETSYVDKDVISYIEEREKQAIASIDGTAEALRMWIRTSDKAMKLPEGEESPPARGREGEKPAPLALAQQQLWEVSHRVNEEVSSAHDALRQKVCQKFDRVDVESLMAMADYFEDGQRIPAQLRDQNHSVACRKLRSRAHASVNAIIDVKEVASAAKQLQTLEHFLVGDGTVYHGGRDVRSRSRSGVPMQTRSHEDINIISKLQGAIVNALVDGSTPPAAFEIMIGALERSIVHSEGGMPQDAKLRLVKRLPFALCATKDLEEEKWGNVRATGIGLPRKYALRMLKACVDPDSLLDHGRLRDFYALVESLELIMRSQPSIEDVQNVEHAVHAAATDEQFDALSILNGFDLQRFSMLVAERCSGNKSGVVSSSGGYRRGGAGSSGSGSSIKQASPAAVGVDDILKLALLFLLRPGGQHAGIPLLEGIAGFSPSIYYAAILAIALSIPDSAERQALMQMISQVPSNMLPAPVIAASLHQISTALAYGVVTPNKALLELMNNLLSSEAVASSMQQSIEYLRQHRDLERETEEMRDVSWTIDLDCLFATVSASSIVNHPEGEGKTTVDASQLERHRDDDHGAAESDGVDVVQRPIKNENSSVELQTARCIQNHLGQENYLVNATTPLELQQVPASHPALASMFQQVVAQTLSRLNSLNHFQRDGSTTVDLFQKLLEVVLSLPEDKTSAWGLQFFWEMYKGTFHPFFMRCNEPLKQDLCIIFRQYWKSLPWEKAFFVQESPEHLASLRAYLPLEDGAAMALLYACDWIPVVTMAHPASGNVSWIRNDNKIATSVSDSSEHKDPRQKVFTLDDEDEEGITEGNGSGIAGKSSERTAEHEKWHSGKSHSQIKESDRIAWATELSLLILQSLILIPGSKLPLWIASLGAVEDQIPGHSSHIAAHKDESILVSLVASADWEKMKHSLVEAKSNGVPWLLHSLLMASCPPVPGDIDVADGILEASMILTDAALNTKSQADTAILTAARSILPLLCASVCQGTLSNRGHEALRPSNVTSAAQCEANIPHQEVAHNHQKLIVPPDIPADLLEGTVEGEQIRLQQEEIRLAEEQAREATVASTLPYVQISSCFRLLPSHHDVLISRCLLPLAKGCVLKSSRYNIEAWISTPAESMLQSLSSYETGLVYWNPSEAISELARQSKDVRSRENVRPASKTASSTDQVFASVLVEILQSILASLVKSPLTIVASGRVWCSNAELPWDNDAAVFVSEPSGEQTARRNQSSPSKAWSGSRATFGNFRSKISSILHRRDAATGSVEGEDFQNFDDIVSSGTDLRRFMSSLIVDWCALSNSGMATGSTPEVRQDFVERGSQHGVAHGDFKIRVLLSSCLLRAILQREEFYSSSNVTALGESILRNLIRAGSRGRETTGGPGTADIQPSEGKSIEHRIVLLTDDESDDGGDSLPRIAPIKDSDSADELADVSQQQYYKLQVSSHLSSVNPIYGLKGQQVSEFDRSIELQLMDELREYTVQSLNGLSDGLGLDHILTVARAATTSKRPLLATFGLSSARLQASTLDKFPWQSIVEQVLDACTLAESSGRYPLELILVWLEALSWINDSRWRRLPPGKHKKSLGHFLESLDHRVQVIQVLTLDDLREPGGLQNRARKALATVARRVSANMHGITEGVQRAYLGDHQAESVPPSDANEQHEPSSGVHSSTGTLLPLSYQQLERVSEATLEEDEDEKRTSFKVGQKLSSGLRSFGRHVGSAGSKLVKRTGKALTEAAGGNAVNEEKEPHRTTQSIASSASTSSRPPEKPIRLPAEVEEERHSIVSIGLAALAIASYVRCVLDPRSTRRTLSGMSASADPGSPRTASSQTDRSLVTHSRGNSSMTGSRHFEEAQLRELDCVLEARESLDLLSMLSEAPLVNVQLDMYSAFFDTMPSLLAVGTSMEQFQSTIVRLLVGQEAEAVCLLLRRR